MTQLNEKQNHDAIDCLRVFLAAGVVAYHVVTDGPQWLMTACHLTVPVFFLISSYFFFQKVQTLDGAEGAKNRYLISFLWRILRLYLCWEIVQLPITLKQWPAYGYGAEEGLLRFLEKFFLGSTFFASWYLMALMLGTLLVYLLGKRLSNHWLLLVGLVFYLFCCGCSGYRNLLHFSMSRFYAPTSFVVSVIWIAMGKTIAEGSTASRRFRSKSLEVKLSLLVFALLVFFLESGLCRKLGWSYRTDAFLSYLFTCPAIFLIVLDVNYPCTRAKLYRTISTVTYCFHGTAFAVMISLGNRVGKNFEMLPYDLICYVCVLAICGMMGYSLFHLRKIRGLGWLCWFC